MAKKWSDIRRKRFSETERAEQDRRIDAELVEMSLAELRRELGVTQAEMASAIEITQSQLSKMERRDDHLVSALRRAVGALGGGIAVTAVVDSKRVKRSVYPEGQRLAPFPRARGPSRSAVRPSACRAPPRRKLPKLWVTGSNPVSRSERTAGASGCWQA